MKKTMKTLNLRIGGIFDYPSNYQNFVNRCLISSVFSKHLNITVFICSLPYLALTAVSIRIPGITFINILLNNYILVIPILVALSTMLNIMLITNSRQNLPNKNVILLGGLVSFILTVILCNFINPMMVNVLKYLWESVNEADLTNKFNLATPMATSMVTPVATSYLPNNNTNILLCQGNDGGSSGAGNSPTGNTGDSAGNTGNPTSNTGSSTSNTNAPTSSSNTGQSSTTSNTQHSSDPAVNNALISYRQWYPNGAVIPRLVNIMIRWQRDMKFFEDQFDIADNLINFYENKDHPDTRTQGQADVIQRYKDMRVFYRREILLKRRRWDEIRLKDAIMSSKEQALERDGQELLGKALTFRHELNKFRTRYEIDKH